MYVRATIHENLTTNVRKQSNHEIYPPKKITRYSVVPADTCVVTMRRADTLFHSVKESVRVVFKEIRYNKGLMKYYHQCFQLRCIMHFLILGICTALLGIVNISIYACWNGFCSSNCLSPSEFLLCTYTGVQFTYVHVLI